MDNNIYGGGFASAYDALMSEDYSHADYAGYIEKIFGRHGEPPEPIVADLGCGTGALCVELARRGYETIGIDRSPDMLAKARENAAASGLSDKIMFLEQELCAFELFGTVGAFVSTFDCINYVADKRRLRSLFRLVGNYLHPGGLFIFDLNTAHKLIRLAEGKVFYEITDDVCYLWQNRFSTRGGAAAAVFDLTFFTRERDGRWRRHDEIHRQRAWLPGDIAAAACGARLEPVAEYSFLGFRRPTAKAEKVSYIYRKI